VEGHPAEAALRPWTVYRVYVECMKGDIGWSLNCCVSMGREAVGWAICTRLGWPLMSFLAGYGLR
jgi:hypothetical protein